MGIKGGNTWKQEEAQSLKTTKDGVKVMIEFDSNGKSYSCNGKTPGGRSVLRVATKCNKVWKKAMEIPVTRPTKDPSQPTTNSINGKDDHLSN